MKQQIVDWIKVNSTFHIPDGRKNILLFSAPRSGSTWLLEILMTQKGYKWIREPFNLRNHYVRKHLGISSWEELYNYSSKNKIENYLQTLANKNIRDIGYRYPFPFTDFWHLITHGTMFKILHACEAYINLLQTKLNGQVIFLIRHPVPVALSREDLPRLKAFINSDYANNFKSGQIEFAKKIIQNGSEFEKGILDWCFQNSVPLRQKKHDWIFITYEALVLNPLDVIDEICNKLRFKEKQKMIKRLHIASGSSKKSKEETRKIVLDPEKLKDSKQWLLEKWTKKVNEQQIQLAQVILDVFEIDIYTTNSILPNTIR